MNYFGPSNVACARNNHEDLDEEMKRLCSHKARYSNYNRDFHAVKVDFWNCARCCCMTNQFDSCSKLWKPDLIGGLRDTSDRVLTRELRFEYRLCAKREANAPCPHAVISCQTLVHWLSLVCNSTWMTRSVSNSKSLPLTPSTSTSTEWKPDLFAQKFVPVALHNINSAQVFFPVYCPSPAYINFEEYAQSFLPKPLYHACASSRILSSIRDPRYAMDTPILGPQIPPQQMNNRNYAVRFRNLLVEERKSLALDFKQYNLFEIPLHPLGHNVYRIDVPGLREDNTPARFVGDSLSVRAIRAKFSTYGTIKYFDGTEYIAYISAIDRLNVSPLRSNKC